MFVGAGTVLTPDQAETARDAGAQFIVAPGFNPRVVDYCLEHGIPVYPGVATPTEVEAALEKGSDDAQVLPGRADGWVSVISRRWPRRTSDVNFMPTGGINAANLASYLAFKRVVACGGSWMAPPDWIAAKQFDSHPR